MTFKDLAIKNFKGNVRKYLSIFLCYSLCVMVLQVFFNILHNKDFLDVFSNKNIKMLMNFSLIVLIIFLVFFISYAIQTFLKLRSKEFGVYLMVGMNRKDLIKLIFIETCIIIAGALIVGFIFGTVLSCLLYIVFKVLLELNNISFSFELISYIKTLAIFLLIFFIQLIFIWLYSKKLHLNEIMKQWKKPESTTMPKPTSSIVLSILAVLMLLFAHINLYNYIAGVRSDNNSGLTPVVFVVCCFVGIYLIISRLGAVILHLFKGSKKNYYNNILTITEIRNKVNQNKKVIFSSTILCIVLIFFVSAAYSILAGLPRVIETEQPYHIVYVDPNKRLDMSKIDRLIKGNNLKQAVHKKLDFLYASRIVSFGETETSTEMAVISDEQYRGVTGKSLDVGKGSIMQINSDLASEANNQFPYDTVKLDFGGKSYDFRFVGEERTILINLKVQPSRFMLIVDADDFNEMKDNVDERYFGTFNMLNFDDWKRTGPLVAELKRQLEDEKNKDFSTSENKDSAAYSAFKMVSRIEYYVSVKRESSMRLFIVSFIGILFLICTSCVIYFKLITDIEQLRIKYKKLKKIGITESEFRKVISNELKVVFFTPVLLGAFLGYILIRIATLNTRMEEVFAVNTLVVIFVFFLFQLIYYIITQKRYNREIIKFHLKAKN
ncbi:ABC transporter permease [Acetivibrio mesophilus]|uniref:ABC transporter permease n=2 Tax=Acetivibrio mesophilus TaxID=2487273 RepID=A0A4Q0I9Q6_9FIRM|nr:hypothetical protein A7W90_08280 [Clostridium sp. Bc-iso-3]RXE60725.1 ABC transporter permease [Acetivibrio mesophilus]